MPRADRPAVFLAFDSPGLELLEEGLADGSLPTVRRLLEQGQYFPIDDHQELLTSPCWLTLIRGCETRYHGQFADRKLIEGTYSVRSIAAEEADRPPFWAHLSDAGLRSTVVSVYGAPIVPGLKGTQVVGWGSNDPINGKVGGARCEPPDVIAQLERIVGPRPPMYGWREPAKGDTREALAYLARTLDGIPRQGRALLELLKRRDYDFFFGSISESHSPGHLLWHYWCASHPLHDPDAPAELIDALRSIYRAIDKAYGEALEYVDPDAGIFLVTPYTMMTNHHLDDAMDTILERGGWLRRRPGAPATGRARAVGLARGVARHLVPKSARRRVMTSIPATQRVRWLDSLYLSDVDWSATQAFPLISDSCAIRFNVVGREPEGTVQPADYDAFRAELAEEFAALEDADTGRLLVDRVLTTEEALGCPPRDSFPDLAVQWHRGQPVRAIRSPSLGEFEVEHTDNRTSIHRTPGFLIASGAGIPPSGETRLDGPPIRLVDVGATALAWLGVDQPATLTGRAVPPLAPAKTSA